MSRRRPTRRHSTSRRPTRRNSWLVLLVLIILAAVGQYLMLDPDERVDGSAGCEAKFVAAPPVAPAGNTTLLCRRQYVVLHDDERKIPLYSAQRLSAADLARDVERTDDFRPDPDLPEGERAELSDYRGSGYDRGHLTAAADADTPQEMSETFLLSNIVPQDRRMNSGVWARLEDAVRDCTRERGETYVITGPVLEGRTRTIGPERVAVPNALYKIIVDSDTRAARAFLMPNRTLPRTDDFRRYEVGVAEIEARTGLEFFPEGAVDERPGARFCRRAFGG